ncbi:MAG: hypothetical protein BMS9Abin29_1369 [Gemmatimonadota bacterium]|nr:MAG: hypothetical protein BMS9Abin29_1369 [Gemmatimonadota bacterium]
MYVTASRARSLGFVGFLLLAASCSTTGDPAARPSPDGRPQRASRSSKVIAAAELQSVLDLNALQVVERLRPTWLRNRGRVSIENQQFQGARLYVDGNRRGYVADMAEILASDIEEMRFLDSREATTRFGTGFTDGVIVITTRRR